MRFTVTEPETERPDWPTTKMLQLPNILGQDVLTQMAAAPPPGHLLVFIRRLDVDLKGLDTRRSLSKHEGRVKPDEIRAILVTA